MVGRPLRLFLVLVLWDQDDPITCRLFDPCGYPSERAVVFFLFISSSITFTPAVYSDSVFPAIFIISLAPPLSFSIRNSPPPLVFPKFFLRCQEVRDEFSLAAVFLLFTGYFEILLTSVCAPSSALVKTAQRWYRKMILLPPVISASSFYFLP